MMQCYKLSEIYELQLGKTPARNKTAYWQDGEHAWVSIADLSKCDMYISDTKERITQFAVDECGIRIIPADTLIMSFKLSIGKVAITKKALFSNEAIMAFIDKGIIPILPQYAYYLFSAQKWGEEGNRAVMGTTLNKAALAQYNIRIHSADEQAQIIEKLNKLSFLIEKRKQQLEKLDLLVKSQFVEMFGNPASNPMNWDVVNISSVIKGKVSNGFFAKREEYCEGGNINVLGVANIVNRMYPNIENLPQANGTKDDIDKFGVKYGDMLFCRSSLVADGIGKASVVPHNAPSNILFECHVIRLPLDLSKCVPEFIQVLSTTEYFRRQIIKQSKTATMTTIGQEGILKTMIILPPLGKQKEFFSFIEQTDKSKITIKRSLEKLETLKKALMQKYFG